MTSNKLIFAFIISITVSMIPKTFIIQNFEYLTTLISNVFYFASLGWLI